MFTQNHRKLESHHLYDVMFPASQVFLYKFSSFWRYLDLTNDKFYN